MRNQTVLGGEMKKGKKPEAISTFLGPDVCIEGIVKFKGTIRLDGELKGSVHGPGGAVVIGESARIEGDIHVGVAVIRGVVKGTVQAEKRIEVYAPGQVLGDIVTPVLSVEEGVAFSGNCTMKTQTKLGENATESASKGLAVEKTKSK
jgi:cytoskeletal protein CcmA (bactofilin family)